MDWSNDIFRNSVLCLMLICFTVIGERASVFGSMSRIFLLFTAYVIALLPLASFHAGVSMPILFIGVVVGYWMRGREDQPYVDGYHEMRRRVLDYQIKACAESSQKSNLESSPDPSQGEVMQSQHQDSQNLVEADRKDRQTYIQQLRNAIEERRKQIAERAAKK